MELRTIAAMAFTLCVGGISKFRIIAFATLMATGLTANAPSAAAQPAQYTYNGSNYNSFTNFTACEAGSCANFNTGLRISGTFQTNAPLAANLSGVNIAAQISTFSFSNGITNFNRSDPNVRLFRAVASTDGMGNINALEFTLQRWQTSTPAAFCEIPGACSNAVPPVAFIAPRTNPNTKFNGIQIRSSQNSAYSQNNVTCQTRTISPSGEVDGCATTTTTDSGASRGNSNLAFPISAVPIIPVPSLSEWALILFGLILAGGAALVIQRRQFAA